MRRAFSVAVFVRRGGEEGQILVIHHKRLGTWLPIGGEMAEGETPLESAQRELREETGLVCPFPALERAFDGVPVGYLGYEEHLAGSKGMHMNFVFLADAESGSEIVPNHEFEEFKWVNRRELESLDAPKNVVEFGLLALSSKVAV